VFIHSLKEEAPMNSWPKLSVMFVAVLATVAGVITLKRMLRDGAPAPVQLPGSAELAEPTERQQPVVLRAKPAPPSEFTGQLDDPRLGEWALDTSSPEATAGEHPRNALPTPRKLDPYTPSLDDPHWQHGPLEPLEVNPDNNTTDTGELTSGNSPQPLSEPIPMAMKPVFVTRPNDSFWTISEELYGSGAFYIALYVHNHDRIQFPDRLGTNIALDTPSAAELRRLYPRYCPSD
jgi:nucleoid-associated protein YgaU